MFPALHWLGKLQTANIRRSGVTTPASKVGLMLPLLLLLAVVLPGWVPSRHAVATSFHFVFGFHGLLSPFAVAVGSIKSNSADIFHNCCELSPPF